MDESEPPVVHYPNDTDWCFDMEQYYSSSNHPYLQETLKKLLQYKAFSYKYNGAFTCGLVACGLVGNFVLLLQIRRSRVFSHRLACHLAMISFWDILYMLSCGSTYGISSLLYGITPYYGTWAYILFFLQPFASFCVLCTIWQVLAITIERYYAVTKPLEQRTRKAKFGVVWISLFIAIIGFLINLLPVPFERGLVDCFEFAADGTVSFSTLLKPFDDKRSKFYKFWVHFIPDFLFRAPVPILAIAILTMKTIQVCNQRSLGTIPINITISRNIPLRLSMLNFKFIVCNSLYMFNTILIELLGYGDDSSAGDEVDASSQFINAFYLSDASNMLLLVHSCTNWLIFYNLPRCRSERQRKVGYHSSVSVQSSGHKATGGVNPRVAEAVLRNLRPVSSTLGEEMMMKLVHSVPRLREYLLSQERRCREEERELDPRTLTRHGDTLVAGIEHILKWLCDRRNKQTLREVSRRLGCAHFLLNANLQFSPDEWKRIRNTIVQSLVDNTVDTRFRKHMTCKDEQKLYPDQIEESLNRAFNMMLSELRSGTLCANVEAKTRSYFRSKLITDSQARISFMKETIIEPLSKEY